MSGRYSATQPRPGPKRQNPEGFGKSFSLGPGRAAGAEKYGTGSVFGREIQSPAAPEQIGQHSPCMMGAPKTRRAACPDDAGSERAAFSLYQGGFVGAETSGLGA